MAYFDGKYIRDKAKALPIQLKYSIGKNPNKRLIEKSLRNHTRIMDNLHSTRKEKINSTRMREWVTQLTAMTLTERASFLEELNSPPKQSQKDLLETILQVYFDFLKIQIPREKAENLIPYRIAHERWSTFFAKQQITCFSELKKIHVQMYCMAWRPVNRINRTYQRKDGTTTIVKNTKPISQRVIRLEFNFLKNAILHASGEELITYRDIFTGVKLPDTKKDRRPYTIEQVKAILELVKANGNRWAYHSILALLLTGMRPSELERITPTDFQTDHLIINKSKTEAGIRDIPIYGKTLHRIKEIGWIFDSGFRGVAYRLQRIFIRARKHLDFEITTYQLRHTAASLWLRSGRYGYGTIADVLGHTDGAFSRKQYAKLQKGDLTLLAKRQQENLDFLNYLENEIEI